MQSSHMQARSRRCTVAIAAACNRMKSCAQFEWVFRRHCRFEKEPSARLIARTFVTRKLSNADSRSLRFRGNHEDSRNVTTSAVDAGRSHKESENGCSDRLETFSRQGGRFKRIGRRRWKHD